jgi:hypothetical protein
MNITIQGNSYPNRATCEDVHDVVLRKIVRMTDAYVTFTQLVTTYPPHWSDADGPAKYHFTIHLITSVDTNLFGLVRELLSGPPMLINLDRRTTEDGR